jgi:antitoxin (DNA-binding transcriptional repressor) of toxin-antitoxin stability system
LVCLLPTARSTSATVSAVRREITQRELRNESGEVMRALDSGDAFLVTRNGVAVGELTPIRRRRFVARDAAVAAFARAPAIDGARWRADLARVIDQDPTPRG